MARIRVHLGAVLIATGEALRRQPAPASTAHIGRPKALSQART